MTTNIIQVSWQSHEQELRFIRTEVFIKEQNVSEREEMDGLDDECIHYLAYVDGTVAGCCRLRMPGKIERLAVLAEFRKHGIGAALISDVLKKARELEIKHVYMHAQTAVIPFYEKLGFIAQGDVFMEAEIPHKHMFMDL